MARTSSQRTTGYKVASTIALVLATAVLIACSNTRSGPEETRQETTPNATPRQPALEQSPAPAKASPNEGPTPNPSEHPEIQLAPAGQTETAPVTKESLAKAITGYVRAETARTGGFFMVPDPEQKTSLALTLTGVHEDRLTRLKDGRYFACADFKGRDGHVYDLDVLMQDSGKGLTASDVIVHKKDGRARYNWVEENGTWQRQAVGAP